MGKKLLDRLVALEHYPINSTEDFKNLMTRVQDAGDGTYLSMHTKITYHYSFLTRRPPTRNVRNMDRRLLVQHERVLEVIPRGMPWQLLVLKLKLMVDAGDAGVYFTPLTASLPLEPRCTFCWSMEGGFYDAFLRQGRL